MTGDDESTRARAEGTFTELPEDECYELLSTTTAGRVAFVNDEGLHLLPINFAVIDKMVYFRTAPNSVLADMAVGMDEVAFGIDYHSELYRGGWNVTVTGGTNRVDDPELLERVSTLGKLRSWAPGERSLFIQLTPRTINGRRVSVQ